jgi:hypothetical protein
MRISNSLFEREARQLGREALLSHLPLPSIPAKEIATPNTSNEMRIVNGRGSMFSQQLDETGQALFFVGT